LRNNIATNSEPEEWFLALVRLTDAVLAILQQEKLRCIIIVTECLKAGTVESDRRLIS
jgi:hypothetical protein